MKQLWGATVWAILLLSQPVAIAAPWDHRPGLQGPERKGYQVQERRLPPRYPPGQRGERPGPGRYDGYAARLTEEERRELRGLPPRYPPGQRGERPGGPGRHDGYAGRLTEEERRELRRDVDRANREIYRQRPPERR